MVEAAKALDSAAASTSPTSVKEEEKAGDDDPVTSTTAATTVTAVTTTTITSPATAAATVASIGTAIDNDSNTETEADSSPRNSKLLESFRAELELYASGDQVDVAPCYSAFEGVFRNPEVREMEQETRNDLMLMLMNSVEGEMTIKVFWCAEVLFPPRALLFCVSRCLRRICISISKMTPSTRYGRSSSVENVLRIGHSLARRRLLIVLCVVLNNSLLCVGPYPPAHTFSPPSRTSPVPPPPLYHRADSERRANLHIRFIRSNPMITTKCCKALHCFR